MGKRIYFICTVSLRELPPALSLIAVTKALGCEVHWVSLCEERMYKKMFDELGVIGHFYKNEDEWRKCAKWKIKRHFQLTNGFNRFVFDVLREVKDGDLVWIVHEDTAARMGREILSYDYFISIYELSRSIKNLRVLPSNVRLITQNARETIVPEYNRAHILAAWWGLRKIPRVLPNKPYLTSLRSEGEALGETKAIVEQVRRNLAGAKMVLYQGAFAKDRNLEFFIDGILASHLPLKPVLMGRENDYLRDIKEKYGDKIIHIPALPAPYHLEITKYAYIGIVSYQVARNVYDPLNVVYCAPNKIFEYSKYSVPMVCSDLPGLRYTVQAAKAGICVESGARSQLIEALLEIMNNYELYQKGAERFFASVDVKQIVRDLLDDNKHLSV